MKFSKLLRFFLIAVAMMTAFALFACNDGEAENDSSSEEIADSSESSSIPDEECVHNNTEVNGNCESVCSDCGAVLGTVDHTPAAPDAEDHCNVKCSNCGKVLEENKHGEKITDGECYEACSVCGDRLSDKAKHTKGDPDPEDHCNIKCVNCGTVLAEGRHARTTEINDNCEEVCTACGDKMSDELKHVEPDADAWKFNPEDPQREYATCERCNGNVYRDVVKTTQGLTLIGPDAISGFLHNPNIVITTASDESGIKYARIEATKAAEGTITVNSGEEALMGVGKYVAVLARRNGAAGGVDFWINAAGKTDHNGATTKTLSIGNDNSWQLLVFDFSSSDNVNKENGIGWTRIDMNPPTDVGDTMDVAFIAFFDSKEDATAYYINYLKAYIGAEACTHVVDNKWKTLGDGKIGMTCTMCEGDANVINCTHFDLSKLSNITPKAETDSCYFTGDCALCGATGVDIPSLTQEQGRVFMAAELGALAHIQASLGLENNGAYSRYSVEYITDDGVLPYVRFISKIDHENCLLLNDGKNAVKGINRYVAILYKKTGESPSIEMFITPAGETAPGNHTNHAALTVNDGTWELAIIDLTDSPKVDIENGAGWLRLDVINAPGKTGDTIDIAYVGFFSTVEKAYEHYVDYLEEYLGVDNCCHSFVTDWTGTGEENKMQNNCVICKKTVVADCDHIVPNESWTTTENTGEIKGECTRCNATVVKECNHPSKTFDENAGFFNYSYKCNFCGVEVNEENKNKQDGLHIFDAETIADAAGAETSTASGTYTTVLMTDETTGLKYTHSVLTQTTKGECFLYFTTPANGHVERTGDYFAILYRQNSSVNIDADCFVASNGALASINGNKKTLDAGGGWTLVVFDYSDSKGWNSEDGANIIRLDLFNYKDITEGSYFDIAYAGFFSSADNANAFYNDYATAYGLN